MSKKNASHRVHRAQKIKSIIETFEREYGVPAPEPGRIRNPLDELVLTVLSQNTNDVNRDRAYESLRIKYPTWEKVAKANQRSIDIPTEACRRQVNPETAAKPLPASWFRIISKRLCKG